jgi:hypothetical protein
MLVGLALALQNARANIPPQVVPVRPALQTLRRFIRKFEGNGTYASTL